jgi:lysozyme family protein
MSAFDQAFNIVIGHEGGYSIDPKDRGNWTGGAVGQGILKGTKYGISAAAYPDSDIKNLSLWQAKEIYKKDYWDRVAGDKLPPGIAFVSFDAAVNAGVSRAIRWLQQGLDVPADGRMGPQTIRAAAAVKDIRPVIVEMLARRAEHNRSTDAIELYGLGWSRRLFSVAFQAMDF